MVYFKHQSARTNALANVDFGVHRGETVAFVGPSGSGKSTLLRVAAGLLEPETGQVLINGTDVTGRPTHQRNVGMVFQDQQLFPHLDVAANVFLGREAVRAQLGPIRVMDKRHMEQETQRLLDRLKIDISSVRLKVENLSGGQRQSVAIARATAFNAKVIIMDEPTAALGVAETAQVENIIRAIKQNGEPLILISHNMNDVMQVADYVACLYLGQMAAQVPVGSVNHSTIVELITTGRSGEMGLQPEIAAAGGVV